MVRSRSPASAPFVVAALALGCRPVDKLLERSPERHRVCIGSTQTPISSRSSIPSFDVEAMDG